MAEERFHGLATPLVQSSSPGTETESTAFLPMPPPFLPPAALAPGLSPGTPVAVPHLLRTDQATMSPTSLVIVFQRFGQSVGVVSAVDPHVPRRGRQLDPLAGKRFRSAHVGLIQGPHKRPDGALSGCGDNHFQTITVDPTVVGAVTPGGVRIDALGALAPPPLGLVPDRSPGGDQGFVGRGAADRDVVPGGEPSGMVGQGDAQEEVSGPVAFAVGATDRKAGECQVLGQDSGMALEEAVLSGLGLESLGQSDEDQNGESGLRELVGSSRPPGRKPVLGVLADRPCHSDQVPQGCGRVEGCAKMVHDLGLLVHCKLLFHKLLHARKGPSLFIPELSDGSNLLVQVAQRQEEYHRPRLFPYPRPLLFLLWLCHPGNELSWLPFGIGRGLLQ